MKESLIKAIGRAVSPLGIDSATIKLDYPENPEHGDFSSNIAMANAKKLGMAPKALAEKIIAAFEAVKPDFIGSVSIAGPGFINFKVKDRFFAEEISKIAQGDGEYGWGTVDSGRKEMVEYTDPNTFKVFHIGHLMSNAIGESIARLIESQGAKVIRICYPSDIGLHIAKSIWAIKKHEAEMPAETAPIQERTAFLGKMYVEGTQAYEADSSAKSEIDALNKVIYDKSDQSVDALYEKGRKWSLDHFEILYKLLGTKFDAFIYESEMASKGLEIVKANVGKVFEESEGAVVFKGDEKDGLHTRVFINSQGLPTYEAKEVGLNITKFEKYPDADSSIIITASEQNAYFKVLLEVVRRIDEKNASKTKRHIGHGMMRFASGKMSSRTGNVVTAESLLADIKKLVLDKIKEREFSSSEADELADQVAVAAIKYTVLRSSVGSDIIFDSSASISFEGDSGPYLQYSAVRANSVLEKGKGVGTGKGITMPEKVGLLEKLISRFPDILAHARAEYAPQHVANYLINLAGAFNSFYASTPILDEKEPLSPYRIAVTKAFYSTMRNGLWVLGIKVPSKM